MDLQTAGVMTPADDPPTLDGKEAFARRTAVMSAGTTLSRITGFLRIAAAAWALGATRLADTYNVANTTPNIIYELALGGILSSVFVPVFVQWLDTRGREEAWEVARRVLTLTLVVLAVIAVIGVAIGPWILRLYLAGGGANRDQKIALGSYFLRWFMPQIVFYGVGAVAIGLLNAHRRFAVPMFAPILNNLCVIATFIVYGMVRGSSSPGLATITPSEKAILGAGTTLGVIAMTLALWPSLREVGFRFAWRWDPGHEAVRRLGRLASWVVVYVVANQVGFLVVILLSYPHPGWVTEFAYALVLFQLPFSIFAVSIFTALLPALSARWTASDRSGFIEGLGHGIRTTSVIILPATAGYLVLAGPIVRLLLQHGLLLPSQADATADALRLFAIGLLPYSLFQLLTRGFYAMQDSRAPGLLNIGANVFNIAVDLILVLGLHMGVGGLALGNSLAYGFGAAGLFLLLRRRLGRLDGRALVASGTRALAASAATALAAWGVSSAIGHTLDSDSVEATIAQVAGGVAAGFLAFLATALIVRIQEVDDVKSMIARRLRA